MAVLKFGFTVMGKSRDEALEELDNQVRDIMTNMTGEPWITLVDDVRKIATGMDFTNPDNFVYLANREVVFAGPNVLSNHPSWRDGFRPQGGSDDVLGF